MSQADEPEQEERTEFDEFDDEGPIEIPTDLTSDLANFDENDFDDDFDDDFEEEVEGEYVLDDAGFGDGLNASNSKALDDGSDDDEEISLEDE
jgi:hypothetical protein